MCWSRARKRREPANGRNCSTSDQRTWIQQKVLPFWRGSPSLWPGSVPTIRLGSSSVVHSLKTISMCCRSRSWTVEPLPTWMSCLRRATTLQMSTLWWPPSSSCDPMWRKPQTWLAPHELPGDSWNWHGPWGGSPCRIAAWPGSCSSSSRWIESWRLCGCCSHGPCVQGPEKLWSYCGSISFLRPVSSRNGW